MTPNGPTFEVGGVLFTSYEHNGRYIWRTDDKRLACSSRCVPQGGKTVKQYLAAVDGDVIKYAFPTLPAAMRACVDAVQAETRVAA